MCRLVLLSCNIFYSRVLTYSATFHSKSIYSAACGINQPNLLHALCLHWHEMCQNASRADAQIAIKGQLAVSYIPCRLIIKSYDEVLSSP